MSYLCIFILYLLGCFHPCSSHIFWPREHIFLYLLYLLSTWFGHMVLLLDTFRRHLCMMRSRPLSCLFMRNSLCLICPQDTAWALVLPPLFSCIFQMFSNKRYPTLLAAWQAHPLNCTVILMTMLSLSLSVDGGGGEPNVDLGQRCKGSASSCCCSCCSCCQSWMDAGDDSDDGGGGTLSLNVGKRGWRRYG
jgi:hypothetical protein